MKYLIALFLIASCVSSYAQTNIALNKPVTASTTEGASKDSSYAVDGNGKTRWASVAADPQWLRVDLGSVQPINRVVLHWERAYARVYTIDVSNDDKTWRTVHSNTNTKGGVQTINLSASGRYVRVMMLSRGTGWAYSLWEVEVYGPVVSSSSSAAPANQFHLKWQMPTKRENGFDLKPEEIGGYEIWGTDSKGDRKYLHKITSGRTLSYSILVSSVGGSTEFHIATYDTTGLYSKFVPIVPISDPKAPVVCYPAN